MKLRGFGFVIATFSVLVFMQACSRPLDPEASCNFVQNAELQRISWSKNLPVRLFLHNSVPPEAYDAIDRAISEYNAHLGGGKEVFKIVARGAGGDLNPVRDGYSMIYWFKTWDADRPTEQARTTIHWAGTEIFEADIRINAANFSYFYGSEPSIMGVDLASLLVHELGHALGLAHNVSTGSVMNFYLNFGQDRRKLSDEDLASLGCEY